MSDDTGTAFARGDVVWHDAFFKGGMSPSLVLGDEDHPYRGTEYITVRITTTEREAAVAIDPDDWTTRRLPRTSYVSPWSVGTLKHADIDRGVGALSEPLVVSIVSEVVSYLR